MTAPVVSVRDLRVSFLGRDDAPVEAVAGVDLDVGDGEFLAVVGPSGCGKSTLLRAVAGLLDGHAWVSGEVRTPHGRGRSAVAWMPQRDALLPWRRALGNAALGARIAGAPRGQARARAAALLEEFGLAGFEAAWPHQMSGGMRQRLALARTVLADKPVLLLDEPFGALDPVTRRRMNAWLASVDLVAHARSHGTGSAVMLVTHDVDEALTLADRVVVMSARPGRVVLEHRVDRAAREPHAAREALLTALTAA